MDLDYCRWLKNVLLVDARSKTAFKEFGDMKFDITYLNDKYDMPFGAFVSIGYSTQVWYKDIYMTFLILTCIYVQLCS